MIIGKKSEGSTIKLYQGIAALNVVALNPTKEELSSILGREMKNDPVYTGVDKDDHTFVDLAFWCKTDSSSSVNNGISIFIPLHIRLIVLKRMKKDGSGCQIIDKYGRSAWATNEEIDQKAIPVYANGPANIDKDYHTAIIGEDTLIEFLKKWLNIAELESWNSITKQMEQNKNVNPGDCEVVLDFKKLIKGNWSELREIISSVKDYSFKAVIGVSTFDGKTKNQIYTGKFMKNGAYSYESFTRAILESQKAGGYPTTEFSVEPLHEYVPNATDFSKNGANPEGSNPWG